MLLLFFCMVGGPNFSWGAGDEDPFAGVSPKAEASAKPETGFFSENFGFRKELMSEVGLSSEKYASSRQSVGFEALKKFSTETKTWAAFDFQARLVRRDGFVGVPNDMEGMNRPGWAFEYHNAYLDFYNLLDPLLTESQQSANLGRFNFRVGRFYVPFGLNLQTDTHGTLLQLSNERNLGFERDWYAGFWGTLSPDLRYDLYYLVGSGYGLTFAGQSGLLATRLSLTNRYSSDYGLEGGLSFIGGQRLDPNLFQLSPAVAAHRPGTNQVDTFRVGLDGRYRYPVSSGLLTWTSELSGGKDSPDRVFTQLHQLEFLHASRRWSLSSQFRWFWQDMAEDKRIAPASAPNAIESSLLAEATWYFSNDVGNSNLHWIKLGCEWELAKQKGSKNVIGTLQYYRYW